VKFPSLVFDVWCSQGFRVIAAVSLTFNPEI